MPGEKYAEVLAINEQILKLEEHYPVEGDPEIQLKIYDLLRDITEATIKDVIVKAGFDPSVAADMRQDAFIALHWALLNFDYDTTPAFPPYWRRVLHNRLVTDYKKGWRAIQVLSEEDDDIMHISGIRNSFSEAGNSEQVFAILEHIRSKYIQRFSAWDNKRDAELGMMLLDHRLLATDDARIPHSEIATT